MRRTALAIGVVLLASACGGGSTGGSTPIDNVTPTPAAPPPPPPPPPPPVATPDPGGANLAGLAVPGRLDAVILCSDAAATLVRGKVSNIEATSRLARDSLAIAVDRDFVYSYDINGFGGPTFGAATRKGGVAFESFVVEASGQEAELQIAKAEPQEFATLGFTHYYNPCFFAATPATTAMLPGFGQHSYDGLADGLYQSSADADRLYGTRATLTFQQSTGKYVFAMTIRAVEEAFAEPAGQAQTNIGVAETTLTLDLATGTFLLAPIVGPNNFAGSIVGRIGGPLYVGAIFTFEMTNPAGDRLWGVVAADGALI